MLDKQPGLGSCEPVPTPELEKIVERLNDLQSRGIIGMHAIGGAFAFIFYAEPIETRDLDVFQSEGEAILIEGYPVQILPESTPLVHEAVKEAVVGSSRACHSKKSSEWSSR